MCLLQASIAYCLFWNCNPVFLQSNSICFLYLYQNIMTFFPLIASWQVFHVCQKACNEELGGSVSWLEEVNRHFCDVRTETRVALSLTQQQHHKTVSPCDRTHSHNLRSAALRSKVSRWDEKVWRTQIKVGMKEGKMKGPEEESADRRSNWFSQWMHPKFFRIFYTFFP